MVSFAKTIEFIVKISCSVTVSVVVHTVISQSIKYLLVLNSNLVVVNKIKVGSKTLDYDCFLPAVNINCSLSSKHRHVSYWPCECNCMPLSNGTSPQNYML